MAAKRRKRHKNNGLATDPHRPTQTGKEDKKVRRSEIRDRRTGRDRSQKSEDGKAEGEKVRRLEG
jgi:hypothetical protein